MADAKKEGKAQAGAAPKKKEKSARAEYKPGRQCPKCYSRMADHADRLACGKCGYTEFKQKK